MGFFQSWKLFPKNEITLQLFTTVLTNVTLLPAIVRSFRKKNYFEFIIFSAVMITSILYHWSEIIDSRIFGKSRGFSFILLQKMTNVFFFLKE
jgi:hypothetical protein